MEGSLLYISMSESLFRTFPIFLDLAIHILLFLFPIEHRRTAPRPCYPCAQQRNHSLEFQSFGHRCYCIRCCMACRQQHHFEFVFYFFPTCLPLCVVHLVSYHLGLRINTPASGFIKEPGNCGPIPSSPFLCDPLHPTPDDCEPAEQQPSF